MIGSRIGAYEIVSRLGDGGMGEVYRARDTKLNRDVALKVLLSEVANDPERLARFRREAQVLASLNHPSIGGIYGLEEGQAGQAGTIALVLELVDGPTLADRISRGPMPLDEALPIAKQMAEALEAAHEQGIVHRDLKPANIKVRDDGTVKVLDFGLATAIEGAGGAGRDLTNSPTITSPAMMTGVGMILGTAAYMAPEQAKGRAVDKRADIWAFGCVLYEMLTGRRLFEAEDVSETLAAVLTRDVGMKTLPTTIPARVRVLLGDCLVRDPKQRLRDIGEARRVLETVIAGAPDDVVAPTAATAGVAALSSRVPWVLACAFAVVALAMLILWAPWREQPPTDRPLVQLDVDLGPDVA
jgi:serine/threonine-protein kinase